MPLPFPDALQEFRVSTSAQEAAVGRASGASVNAVTKAGTNQFHGNAFWFVPRHALQRPRGARRHARTSCSAISRAARSAGRSCRTGCSSSPATRARSSIRRSSDTLSIVPTPAMLAGDWTRVQPLLPPALARRRLRRRHRQPGALQPGGAAPGGAAAAAGSTRQCGELLLGQPHRSARQADRDAHRLPAQQQPVVLRPLHGDAARSAGHLRREQPADRNRDRQRLQRYARTRWSLGNNWVINPTTVELEPLRLQRAFARGKQGARFFSPEDVGIAQWTSVPGHFPLDRARATSPSAAGRWRCARWTEPVPGRPRRRRSMRGAHQFGVGGTWAYDDVVSLAHSRGVGGITHLARTTPATRWATSCSAG